MKDNVIKTRDIERTKRAAVFIGKIKKRADRSDIRTEIESLPARIRTNGLTQCFMYLLEKEKKDRNVLGRELVDFIAGGNGGGHVEKAVDLCANRIRWATSEAYAYTRWLKLMAKAEIPKKTTSEKDTENDPSES